MSLIKKVVRAAVAVALIAMPTFGAPAIGGTGISSSGGVTTFGVGGGSASANISTGVISIMSASGQGIPIGGSSPSITPGSLEAFVNINNFGQGTNLFNTTGTARVVGFTQAFTTDVASVVSFDYISTHPSGLTGDPFAFLIDTSTNTTVQFIRGGVSRTLDSDASGNYTFGGAASTGSVITSGYFSGLAGNELAAGNYIIGFGYGVSPSGGGTGTFTVDNVRAVGVGVPEIDASSAAIPMAIVLLCFCVVSDRRRSALVKV